MNYDHERLIHLIYTHISCVIRQAKLLNLISKTKFFVSDLKTERSPVFGEWEKSVYTNLKMIIII